MSIVKLILSASMYVVTLVMNPIGVEMPLQRDKVQTPITEYELENVLRIAHHDVFGSEPRKNRLAMGWAQVALENGKGSKTYNFNLGNIGAGKHQPYYLVGGSHYRSFDSFMQAARTYWFVVSRCKTAMQYFDAGWAVPAAHALRRCGYFRADVDEYSSELNSLFNQTTRSYDVKW